MSRATIVSIAIVTSLWSALSFASGFSFGNFKAQFYGVATLCALGGIYCLHLGYKLFLKGIEKGKGQLEAKSKYLTIVLSGAGPGLFFMAFGAIILMIGVIASFLPHA